MAECASCGRKIYRNSMSSTGWQHKGKTTEPPCDTKPPVPAPGSLDE